MQPSHLGADQPLDMSAEARRTRRPPVDRNARILAATLEGATPEIRAVVHMKPVGKAGHGPGLFDLARFQPGSLVINRMQQAEARRKPGWRVHGQIKARHHTAEDIHGQRKPGSSDRFAGFLIDDKDVGFGVIDLNNLEGSGGAQCPGDWRRCFYGLRFAPALRPVAQVQVAKTPLDRSTMRLFQSFRIAIRFNVPHQLRDRLPGWFQIVRADCLLYDLLASSIQRAMARRASALGLNERHHGSVRPKPSQQTVGRRLADLQFRGKIGNSGHS